MLTATGFDPKFRAKKKQTTGEGLFLRFQWSGQRLTKTYLFNMNTFD
jgi:hypothetical protein